MEELLEKIPVEKRWELTAKILIGIYTMIGDNAANLGQGRGDLLAILGWEKWVEILKKTYGENGRKFVLGLKTCSTYS